MDLVRRGYAREMDVALYTALNAVKVLRSSVGQVFDTLGNGLRADHGEDGKDTKFLFELQELLSTVNINLRSGKFIPA